MSKKTKKQLKSHQQHGSNQKTTLVTKMVEVSLNVGGEVVTTHRERALTKGEVDRLSLNDLKDMVSAAGISEGAFFDFGGRAPQWLYDDLASNAPMDGRYACTLASNSAPDLHITSKLMTNKLNGEHGDIYKNWVIGGATDMLHDGLSAITYDVPVNGDMKNPSDEILGCFNLQRLWPAGGNKNKCIFIAMDETEDALSLYQMGLDGSAQHNLPVVDAMH